MCKKLRRRNQGKAKADKQGFEEGEERCMSTTAELKGFMKALHGQRSLLPMGLLWKHQLWVAASRVTQQVMCKHDSSHNPYLQHANMITMYG